MVAARSSQRLLLSSPRFDVSPLLRGLWELRLPFSTGKMGVHFLQPTDDGLTRGSGFKTPGTLPGWGSYSGSNALRDLVEAAKTSPLPALFLLSPFLTPPLPHEITNTRSPTGSAPRKLPSRLDT